MLIGRLIETANIGNNYLQRCPNSQSDKCYYVPKFNQFFIAFSGWHHYEEFGHPVEYHILRHKITRTTFLFNDNIKIWATLKLSYWVVFFWVHLFANCANVIN